MPLPQACRDCDVKRTADCFRLREAEASARALVPQAYDAIGIDDSIRNAGNETVGELRWINLHVSSQPPARRCRLNDTEVVANTNLDPHKAGWMSKLGLAGLDASIPRRRARRA